jgi:predicted N-acetyltransferase YhbS
MNKNDNLIKGYQENALLRESFNELASATFGLNFEDWYENGYWKDNYIPYSILEGNKIVANVSVSPMKFFHQGKALNIVQLGTVMVDEAYRKQGLIRKLIGEIEKDYLNKTDGYFLFANDSVLDFYPKFGYQRASEFVCAKELANNTGKITAQKISIQENQNRMHLEEAIRAGCIQSDFYHINHLELVMFYVTKFMSDSIYEVKSQNAYVIAEINREELVVHQIVSKEEVNLDQIIAAFGGDITKVVLGFTPLSKQGYQVEELKEKNTTLFIKGDSLKMIETDFLRIPILAHA